MQTILASRNRSPPAGTTNYTEKLITNLLSKYLPLLKRVPLDKSQDYCMLLNNRGPPLLFFQQPCEVVQIGCLGEQNPAWEGVMKTPIDIRRISDQISMLPSSKKHKNKKLIFTTFFSFLPILVIFLDVKISGNLRSKHYKSFS